MSFFGLRVFGGNKKEESAPSVGQVKRIDQGEHAPESRTSDIVDLEAPGMDRAKDLNRKTPPSVLDVDRYRDAGLRLSSSRSPSADPLAMDHDYDERRDSKYGVGSSKMAAKDDEQEGRDCRRKIDISAGNPLNNTYTSSSSSGPQQRDLSKDVKPSRGKDNSWPQNLDKKPHHDHHPQQQYHQKKIVFGLNSSRDKGNGYGGHRVSGTSAPTAPSAMQQDFDELKRQREDDKTAASSRHWTGKNAERRHKDDKDRDRDRDRHQDRGRDNRDCASSRSHRDDDRARTVERERDRPRDRKEERRHQPPTRPKTPDPESRSLPAPMDQDPPLLVDASTRGRGDSGSGDRRFEELPITVEPSNPQPTDREDPSKIPVVFTTISDNVTQANQGNGFNQYAWPPAQAGPSLSGWKDDHDSERAAWEAQKRELEELIEQRTTENQIQDADIVDLHLQLAGAKETISRLRQDNKGLSGVLHAEREKAKEMKGTLNDFEQLKRNHRQLAKDYGLKVKLLKTRTEELALAQAFMTTADTCSVADISRMVEQLNDDIYQFAVLISDAVLHAKSSGTAVSHEIVVQARGALEQMWNEELVRRMHMAVAEEDTILFECFVQYNLANWCHDVVRSFVDNPDAEEHLQALWKGINQSQEPSIARNWLAITYSELKTQQLDSSHTMQDLIHLMNAPGWVPDGETRAKFKEQVESKFADLTAKARKIKQMVFEGILSADVRTSLVPLGACYDPEEMEDAHDMGSGKDSGSGGSVFGATMRQEIVCPVGLGLVATRRREGSDKQTKMEERMVVLKPKVLLLSTLNHP
ncbi:hypothetical protein EST38_g143 [Candolleomyces aberdarensis]|uniref:Uncharacterized protein n=1 Tax=Candolleomyces aberdarensis TaxID=2316362 RepID=A0A4Q2DY75_9AGAR|nr:hypothetical protein EST38_g143 [Candolleomyces aberdarensis]